jgi:hypothetical protein
MQFWDIYSIVNEQGCTVRDAWDGVNLNFTFRRTVGRESMDHWYELLQTASEIRLSEEEDAIIWQYNLIGRYSVKSMHAIVNNRGVKQIYTPVMWSITVPQGCTSSSGCWPMDRDPLQQCSSG